MVMVNVGTPLLVHSASGRELQLRVIYLSIYPSIASKENKEGMNT